MSRALLLVYIASFAALTSFYLMLGITPLFAIAEGHSDFNAAITTTVFMLATVAAELVTSLVMRRIGQQATLALGILLMGLPALAPLLSGALAVIVLSSAVRGTGFALVIIAGAAMVASLTDESRHGRGIALYGVVVGIPSIVALPFGVWLIDQVGFGPLFWAAGAVAALALPVLLVPIDLPRVDEVHGLLRTMRQPAMLALALVFMCATFAAGVIITWVPITVGDTLLAAIALLAYGTSTTLFRWIAGHLGDQRDPRVLLAPAVLVSAMGLLLIAIVPSLVVAGAFVFGAGLGLLQNATLQLMFRRSGPRGYGAASAMWNISYDLGLAGGAFAFGALAFDSALPVFLAAGVVLVALCVVVLMTPRRRSDREATPPPETNG